MFYISTMILTLIDGRIYMTAACYLSTNIGTERWYIVCDVYTEITNKHLSAQRHTPRDCWCRPGASLQQCHRPAHCPGLQGHPSTTASQTVLGPFTASLAHPAWQGCFRKGMSSLDSGTPRPRTQCPSPRCCGGYIRRQHCPFGGPAPWPHGPQWRRPRQPLRPGGLVQKTSCLEDTQT